VPYLLRVGANRAFHEAVGELARLASEQIPYLNKLGLIRTGQEPEASAALLQSALGSIVFLPFAAGTMTHFEYDLYERDLPVAEWQDRWWQYAATYQGVAPPGRRAPDLCDACTKTHINDDPAQYYDYAIATLIKFQLHDHICRKIVKQDPRTCDYSGSEPAGRFLRDILKLGATHDWRQLMRETTGHAGLLSARVAGLGQTKPRVGLRALETNRLESDQVRKGGAAGANGVLVE
jgi:peptidyl-dipeptidase A